MDRDFTPASVRLLSKSITTAAIETGVTANGSPHELLTLIDTVKEAGYVYVYLRNDEAGREVYFDDFKIEHVKSPVIQSDDYYPFGLTFNSYQRENSLSNQYQYNEKEMQDELSLGWLDYGARMYTPEIGRFFKQDRFSEQYLNLSPYQYAINNPLLFVDINGDSISTAFFDKNGNRMNTIPDIVQKMFNKEYGISVGYNSKTGMMYYTGEVETENKVSESAKETIVSALTDDVGGRKAEKKYGQLAFGYGNFGDTPPPLSVSIGASNRRVAWMNLDDFNNDKYQSINKIDYSDLDASGVSRRVFNLGRVFEHEWMGHVLNKRGDGWGFTKDGPTVHFTNRFYREMGLPERLNYAMPIFFSHENSRSSFKDLRTRGLHGQTVPRVFYKRD